MGRRKGKRTGAGKPLLPQAVQTLVQPTALHATHTPTPDRWRFSRWLWFAVVAGSVLLAYFAVWPNLSVGTDFSYDSSNVYNTSFLATNDGYWPAQDLSAVCKAHVILLSPETGGALPLDTTDANHSHFQTTLHWHHHASIPCNHNVIANGHLLAPNSTLAIEVSYTVAGIHYRRSQIFNFHTMTDWQGRSYWQYDD